MSHVSCVPRAPYQSMGALRGGELRVILTMYNDVLRFELSCIGA
jgi:hypothetical protein